MQNGSGKAEGMEQEYSLKNKVEGNAYAAFTISEMLHLQKGGGLAEGAPYFLRGQTHQGAESNGKRTERMVSKERSAPEAIL